MENTPALETERLVLRQFTENDIEALFRIFSDEEVNPDSAPRYSSDGCQIHRNILTAEISP